MKKVLPLLLATLLVGAVFTGCDNKSTALSNYADPISESEFLDTNTKLYTAADIYNSADIGLSNYDCLSVKNADGKWIVKSITTGETVINTAYDYIDINNNYNLMLCRTNAESTANYAYSYAIYNSYTKESVATFTSTATPSVSTGNYYVDGKRDSLLTIKYTANSEAKEISTLYFTKNELDDFADAYNYEAVDESKITKSLDLEIGTTYSKLTETFEINTLFGDDNPCKDLDGYSISMYEGTVEDSYVYDFYKNGKKKSSLNVNSNTSEVVGFHGTDIYYIEHKSVPTNADEGYNLVYQETTSSALIEKKYDVSLYKFNVKNGKTKEIKMKDYIYADIEPLYNYKNQSFDAFIAAGYKINDEGYAQVNEDPVYHIVDKNFKVIMDFTNKPFNFGDIDCKLDDNRFLVTQSNSCYIIDSKLNIVASYELANTGDIRVYSDMHLIVLNDVNGKEFAVDFNGKVVLANVYEDLRFNDGKACTKIYDNEGSLSDSRKFVDTTNPNGADISLGNGEEIVSKAKGILVIKNTENNSYRIINYAGSTLATFDNVTYAENLAIYNIGDDLSYGFVKVTTLEGIKYVYFR